MDQENNWLIIGKLVAPQGLQGEVRGNPSSDFPERFTCPGKRWIQSINKDKEPTEIELIKGRQVPGRSIYIVRFKGINDRNSAESLIGKHILVPASHRPNLKKGEFHLLELVGLEVKFTSEGQSIGIVTDLTTAGNDLLEVKLRKNGKKVLIPFVKEIVPTIEIKKGWLIITPPPGLLEI